MKHLWFGIGLLAALLAAGLWLGGSLDDWHLPAAKDLDKAADAALAEDWGLAQALCIRAEKHWCKHRNLTAVVTHHDLIDQIDAGFAALEDYIRCEETSSFAATCSQLAGKLRSLHQSHGFHWWNLL